MYRKLINERFGCIVHSDNLDLRTFSAELQNCHVQRLNGADIPDMGLAHVNGDTIKRLAEMRVPRDDGRPFQLIVGSDSTR